MPGQEKKKSSKAGRNRYGDAKCGPSQARYVTQNRRFKNKLRRVEKYNGEVAAKAYQAKYAGVIREPKSLVRRKG